MSAIVNKANAGRSLYFLESTNPSSFRLVFQLVTSSIHSLFNITSACSSFIQIVSHCLMLELIISRSCVQHGYRVSRCSVLFHRLFQIDLCSSRWLQLVPTYSILFQLFCVIPACTHSSTAFQFVLPCPQLVPACTCSAALFEHLPACCMLVLLVSCYSSLYTVSFLQCMRKV